MPHADVAIVGAGPVGAALALLLADSGLSVQMLEARAGAATDGRTLALSHGSRLILESCGAWPASSASTPITHIHVSHKGAFGRSVLAADECDVPALGYVIPYAALQSAMDERLVAAGVSVLRGARVNDIAASDANIRIGHDLDGSSSHVDARLLVLADGGANLSRVPGIRIEEKDYGQTALVAAVTLDQPHQGMAWERFTPDGPAALLPKGPATEGHYSLVWTTSPEGVATLLALDDTQFLAQLTAHFGERAGRFLSVGKRASFPLRLRVASPRVATRVAVIGAAAQTLHPVAGQGFNMGLRDADDLARLLCQSAAADPGSHHVLRAFADLRQQDTQMGVRFTDSLVGLFSTAQPVVTWGRGLGLAALDMLPPLRRALARRMLYAIERPDVTVLGGGPVGLAAALALHTFANIRVLEAGANLATRPANDAIDLRVYAVSPASRALLESLGVWDRMRAARISPIRAMHIFGDAAPGELVLDARRPLAWMVEHDELVAALAEAVLDAGIHVQTAQHASRWQAPSDSAPDSRLVLDESAEWRQSLIIGADGAQSWLRQAVGLAAHHKAYDSLGVVASFSCERPHQGIARQWFKGDSVLAWLPTPGQNFSIVWSVSEAEGKRLQSLDKAALADAVRQAGGGALGELRVESEVAVFPLRRTLAPVSVAEGLVLLGDAAHAIHPLAGQGVNLGFGDVAALRDILQARGPLTRMGSLPLLRRYERSRREDIAAMALLTDRLKSLFESAEKPLPTLRNVGMAWLDRRHWLKHAIIRRAMG